MRSRNPKPVLRNGLVGLVGLLVLATVGLLAGCGGAETTGTVPADEVPVVASGAEGKVVAEAVIEPERWNELHFDATGDVVEVLVEQGDAVSKDDLLARLETDDLERAVTQAELDLRQAQLGLEQLQEPAEEADVRQAQHAVDQAAAALRVAQMDVTTILNSTLLNETLEDAQEVFEDKQHKYEARLDMYESGEEPDYWLVDQAQERLDDAELDLDRIRQQGNAQLQDARNAVDWAQQSCQEAEDNLKRLLEGADPLDVEAAQLSVEAAELVLEEALDTLTNASLVAPSDGVVLDVNVIQGQTVNAGFGAVRMADPYALEPYATIIEEDYTVIEVGQLVEVFFDALPEHTVLGRIARIVPEKIPGERPLYTIYIELEEVPAGLAEGMTVDASIIIDSRADVLRLPRAMVQARSDRSAEVTLWINNQKVKRTIQVGLRGDVYIEILDGLQERDLVVGQ